MRIAVSVCTRANKIRLAARPPPCPPATSSPGCLRSSPTGTGFRRSRSRYFRRRYRPLPDPPFLRCRTDPRERNPARWIPDKTTRPRAGSAATAGIWAAFAACRTATGWSRRRPPGRRSSRPTLRRSQIAWVGLGDIPRWKNWDWKLKKYKTTIKKMLRKLDFIVVLYLLVVLSWDFNSQ